MLRFSLLHFQRTRSSLTAAAAAFSHRNLPTKFEPSLLSPFSSRSRRRRRRRTSSPPVNHSHLDVAISRLPPQFSPSDLSAALASLPDPRLCPLLLSWSLHHHPRCFRPIPAAALGDDRSNDDDSSPASPFIVSVRRLAGARLYTEMESVASLALSLPSLPFSRPQYNALIRHFSEAQMLHSAVNVYKRMLASDDPSVRPAASTYNILFADLLGRGASYSYVRHTYMNAVRSLFRQMVDSGVVPDRPALNALVEGYARSLHLNDALRVFHQMGPVYGMEPDERTYGSLVHGLCAQGRTRNAMELYEEMRSKGMAPSGRCYNSLVCALAMAGETQTAEEIMWAAVRTGRALDRLTCKTLLDEVCRRGGMDIAAKLLREMEEKEVMDGRTCRELLHGIQDEFGDCDDDGAPKGRELRSSRLMRGSGR